MAVYSLYDVLLLARRGPGHDFSKSAVEIPFFSEPSVQTRSYLDFRRAKQLY